MNLEIQFEFELFLFIIKIYRTLITRLIIMEFFISGTQKSFLSF